MSTTTDTGVARSLLNIFFPPVCPLCEDGLRASTLPFCKSCYSGFSEQEISGPLCEVCGTPFATTSYGNRTCGACLLEEPPFHMARSAFVYNGKVLEALRRFKYSGKVTLGSALGELVTETCRLLPVKPDVIIPVPLHGKRLKMRGFNQSLLLAREVGRRLSIPVQIRNLIKNLPTRPQVELKAEERMKNVRGAFTLNYPHLLKGKKVLLIDDVLTTGETVKECSKVLKKAGAEVFAVTLARTVKE